MRMLAWPFLVLFALLAWHGLENSHAYYVRAVSQGWGPWLIGVAAIPLVCLRAARAGRTPASADPARADHLVGDCGAIAVLWN